MLEERFIPDVISEALLRKSTKNEKSTVSSLLGSVNKRCLGNSGRKQTMTYTYRCTNVDEKQYQFNVLVRSQDGFDIELKRNIN